MGVPEVLRRFWSVCGGVVEWFAEPKTWWYCHTEVLTVSAARHGLASVVAEYEWMWRDAGLVVPVEAMRSYVTVAIEANGIMTAAHRDTGDLVLFAPDHSFDGVTPLRGSPPLSLYGFDEVPDVAAWVEVCARAWRPEVV
ncbi:hypothetical protein [Lentzea guizhouensis]|uniref:hypothetical protein n=1 Tax=Lentzea guizhouensis TaxID=1586287 RepID=UPI001C54E810|nr:hypothetical protein [Lentzea guizhouensis]